MFFVNFGKQHETHLILCSCRNRKTFGIFPQRLRRYKVNPVFEQVGIAFVLVKFEIHDTNYIPCAYRMSTSACAIKHHIKQTEQLTINNLEFDFAAAPFQRFFRAGERERRGNAVRR